MIPKPTMPMTAPVQNKSKAEVGFRLLTSPVPCCCCQKTLFGLPGLPGSCHGGRLISFLRFCFIIFQMTSQTLRIQLFRPHWGADLLAAACLALSAAAAAVVPILAIASMNNQSEGDGEWQE